MKKMEKNKKTMYFKSDFAKIIMIILQKKTLLYDCISSPKLNNNLTNIPFIIVL